MGQRRDRLFVLFVFFLVAAATAAWSDESLVRGSDARVMLGGGRGSESIVTLCHTPPGNPGNASTIVVGQSAVPAHLAHGDSLGACPAACYGVPSPVPKTGQTTCWDQDGNPIDCAGTGQDGEYQKGVSVTPRFTDNGDGTVKDNLTGLIWLKDARCAGPVDWTGALVIAKTLANGECGLTDGSSAGDWRLPNVKELQSLIDYGQGVPALPPGYPFAVQSEAYWSSTSVYLLPIYAWCVNVGTGGTQSFYKPAGHFVWPVRGEQRGDSLGARPAGCTGVPSPVPKTGQTTCSDQDGNPIDCAGTGQDGEYQKGVSVSPRFTDDGDGTVKDNLTGLFWVKDATCTWGNWTTALNAAKTLASGACGLTDGSVAGDWRLPNARELLSLIDYGHGGPALPSVYPFVVYGAENYWSSTSELLDPTGVLVVNLGVGTTEGLGSSSNYFPVWPVRNERCGMHGDDDRNGDHHGGDRHDEGHHDGDHHDGGRDH